MGTKKDSFPGLTSINEQVFVREGEELSSKEHAPTDHPHIVIIYSWGDALLKHIKKYSDGYRQLFPHAKQVIVLSPIMAAMRQNAKQRAECMKPVIAAAFGTDAAQFRQLGESLVLAHVMSNTGGINYAATLYAFQEAYGRPLPHHLTVLDSTPGSVHMNYENLKRWSRAMALGTYAWFPWPFVVTQCLWAAFLLSNRFVEHIIGRETAPVFSVRILNDKTYESTDARRLFLYSHSDDLILGSDIERNIVDAREAGYDTDAALFEGSGHVGHMRQHPEKYWAAIKSTWFTQASHTQRELN
ncbi:hypothetical protein SPI_08301 [Niveomyces insectorum RCEF 264]|uniref:PaxU n=1 Tax=Niveomyces insectorum RCEF 264 TaxID=1081102 RepID=A0A167N701_9HYPO|nr:hypothetical protein SPI_08301 [Niveomyces insectorum RCEF 264]